MTGEQRWRAGAERALAYERSLYDPAMGNWPDLRETAGAPAPVGSAFATFWCHGAPGIALARLRANELAPDDTLRDEAIIAQALRRASPTATPNARIVSLADRLLGRNGRMIAAIENIGRGDLSAEAVPFRLDLE